MPKTPDEIKNGLEVCNIWMVDEPNRCMECPYFRTKDCADTLMKHALARIQQLEAERDAAVDALQSSCTCPECKYFSDDIQDPCRGCKPTDSKFEWRGVQKEESPC